MVQYLCWNFWLSPPPPVWMSACYTCIWLLLQLKTPRRKTKVQSRGNSFTIWWKDKGLGRGAIIINDIVPIAYMSSSGYAILWHMCGKCNQPITTKGSMMVKGSATKTSGLKCKHEFTPWHKPPMPVDFGFPWEQLFIFNFT